ncbi:MAG: hypothetical protein QM756_40465 [Polyangiaceae bacterium]
MQRVAVNLLEIGEAVVATEAGLVAEEQQHQGESERLRDDREVDATNARAERQEAEAVGEQPRRHQGGDQREEEAVHRLPEPGQLLPVEEHHEVGQLAAIDTSFTDGQHQGHAHGVAAHGEEHAMAQAQDAGVTPEQVHGDGHGRVTQELAEQRHQVVRQLQRRAGRQRIEQWHERDRQQRDHAERDPALFRQHGLEPRQLFGTDSRRVHATSAARPLSAKMP